MKGRKGKLIAEGIALAAGYLLTYRLLHYVSFDQWFLPAGLRATCFLFIGRRYLPFVLIGDAGALATLRFEMSENYGSLWAYLSPALVGPLIAALILFIRSSFEKEIINPEIIPIIAIPISAWSQLSNISVNWILSGPSSMTNLASFHRGFIGCYIGIISVTSLYILLKDYRTGFFKKHWIIIASVITTGISSYVATSRAGSEEWGITLLFLSLTLIPTGFFLLASGWHGAAIGVIVTNTVAALSLTYSGVPGNYDHNTLQIQQALAIFTGVMLYVGGKISRRYSLLRRWGIERDRAMQAARSSFLSAESLLRDQLIYFAHMQIMLDDERNRLAQWMRSNGKYREAMALNAQGMEHRRAFDEQALALYPIDIERQGLYAVVYSQAFRDFWAGEAEIALRIHDGDLKALSVDLQLVAYRCLCHALVTLSDCDPEQYRIRLRVWRTRERQGLYIRVTAVPTGDPHPTPAAATAATLLQSRLSAHGGLMRRHAHEICLLIGEPVDPGQGLRTSQRVTPASV